MTRLETLNVIRSFDPDGMETQPTKDDYRIFESWVKTRYGQDMWEEYNSMWDYPEI